MEPPMHAPMSNGSMQHHDPDLDFDDTRVILQGASYTIAEQYVHSTSILEYLLRYGCPGLARTLDPLEFLSPKLLGYPL